MSDADVEKWVADHPDRYRTPPRVRVRYVAYRPKDFAALAAPSDADVKAYYDEHRDDRFTAPEEVRARHILIKVPPAADEKARAAARKKAEDVLAKVKNGRRLRQARQEQSPRTPEPPARAATSVSSRAGAWCRRSMPPRSRSSRAR